MAFPQTNSQPYYLSVYDQELKPRGSNSSRHWLVFVIILAIIVIILTVLLLAIHKQTCASNSDCSTTQTCVNGYCS